MAQSDPPTSVYLVDDDASLRRAVTRLLHAAGIQVRAFGSIDEFLSSPLELRRACVVADAFVPGEAGVHLPQRLHAAGRNLPVILITAEDNGRLRTAAKSAGAAGFFHKPVDAQVLIDAIQWALDDPGQRAHAQGDVYEGTRRRAEANGEFAVASADGSTERQLWQADRHVD